VAVNKLDHSLSAIPKNGTRTDYHLALKEITERSPKYLLADKTHDINEILQSFVAQKTAIMIP
jgi:hypothetical protein